MLLTRSEEPKGVSGKWVTVGLILLMLVTWTAIYSRIVIEREIPKNNVTMLDPGYHLVDKVPFYITVGPHEYCIITERSWYYETKHFKH